MQVNKIKRIHPNKKAFKFGRGGKHAKTAGRGTKGQKARAGRKLRPELRDMIKKLPKLRGRGKNSFKSFEIKPATVNFDAISKLYTKGETVSKATLIEKGLVHARARSVKILAKGELTSPLTFSGVILSTTAKAALEKSGGTIA